MSKAGSSRQAYLPLAPLRRGQRNDHLVVHAAAADDALHGLETRDAWVAEHGIGQYEQECNSATATE